jgi:hypothetical protein
MQASTRGSKMITESTRRAILSTWDSIASDAYEICEGDNEIAIELVLDASRMTMNGFPEADEEVRALNAVHGYVTVRAELSKKIQLL